MKAKTLTIFALVFLASMSLASAISVDAEYVTLYPGEQDSITIEVENTGSFDIEDVSIQLIVGGFLPDDTPISLPFAIIGSSEKDLDDLDEDDDDSVTFTLRASIDITPGDYNIPYVLRFVDADDNDDDFERTGSFSIWVSSKTDIDFGIEIRGDETNNAILDKGGKISLEIINKGLGEIKSVSVQIIPEGFNLLSKEKIFVGSIDADDTDLASFDVIFKSTEPVLRAVVTYKDFDNNEQKETVSLPFKVYTKDEALEMGLIKKGNTTRNIVIVVLVIIGWIIWRRARKKRRNNKKGR